MDDPKPPRLLRASPLETGFLFGLGFFFAGAVVMALAAFFGYAFFTHVLR
jgi:hypothetical protein